jgi:hypothetical protein
MAPLRECESGAARLRSGGQRVAILLAAVTLLSGVLGPGAEPAGAAASRSGQPQAAQVRTLAARQLAPGSPDGPAVPGWAVQSTPDVLAEGELRAIACPAATVCVAAGDTLVSAGVSTAEAQVWNGTAWTLQQLPVNPHATQSSLSGVACSSAVACVAVGYYRNGAGTSFPLAELWNGTSWTLQLPPVPSAARDSHLNGVSCVPASCTAVGYYQNSTGTSFPLAEQWNGTTWTVQPSQNPPGSAVLTGVSCGSATSCTAVGYNLRQGGTELTLAEVSNGSQWGIQLNTRPQGQNSDLTGVSCSAATSCAAVGSASAPAGVEGTLALVRAGNTWVLRPPANPPGGYGAYLDGVSCMLGGFCIAVGSYGADLGTALTLAESWNPKARQWTIQPLANPATTKNADYTLGGISCLTVTSCATVGANQFTGAALAEIRYGTTWAPTPASQPAQASDGAALDSVSCPSADGAGALWCMAVGFYRNSSYAPFTLAETWSADAWTIKATPLPPGATGAYLFGVSCVSATSCTAVGYWTNSAGYDVALAERWDGHTWAIQTIPDALNASLMGVSCTSASSCTAVGYDNTTSGPSYVAVLAELNGSTWTLHFPPTPSGAGDSALAGVSCTSASTCTAVGFYGYGSGDSAPLAETGHGSAWTIQPAPTPSGTSSVTLEAVSCSSASTCTAVGFDLNSSANDITLAEIRNGSTWTIQPTPNPSGTQVSSLSAVSCNSAATCTAVGLWHSSSLTKALVETK